MAYLHCHSCDWSQDDFHSKSYNLWTKIKSDINWLWKPKVIQFDGYLLEEIKENSPVPVYLMKDNKVFSWNWLLVEFVKDIKVNRNMKWKTWEDWKQDRDTAVCPKCGEQNFDID